MSQQLSETGPQSLGARRSVGTPFRPDQLHRHNKQALSEALQRGSLQMGWGTEALEPIQQVVGQQEDLAEADC